MIIAHLARACYPFQSPGGLESHVYHLTLELARLGQRVELYLPPPTTGQTVDDPAWRENVRSHYLPYTTVGLFRRNSIPDRLLNYPLFSRELGLAVRRAAYRPDIVHAHGLAGWGYARQGYDNVPLVLNPHGMEEFKNTSRAKGLAYTPFRGMLRQTAQNARAVIATDAALIREVESFLAVEPARVALVPNAVALDELDEATRLADLKELTARYELGDDQSFVMLSVGRLEANKGFDIMLEALTEAGPTLSELWPGWVWLVVGSGSEEGRLRQIIERRGLIRRVKLVGGVDPITLHGLYELADLFVQPTRYEGSSLVTLESLAHAKPVLASRTGGLPDKVFEDGTFENGRLVPPGDAHKLAAGLLELARLPPTERQRLGRNGRTLVETAFSWQSAARRTVELYETILANPKL